jgi:phosphoglycolate phosphatase-like HAD superfamily hydrolase
MAFRAVFFDVDGTLVDSNEFHVSAWEEAIHAGGLFVERDAIRGQIGKGGDNLLPSLFPQITQDQQETLSHRHGEIFKLRYQEQVRAFPRATDLIARLHNDGRKVLLASSAKQAEIDFYIDLLDARPYIDAATTIDEVESSKPSGDIFASALGKIFPMSAREAIVVGDTPYDVTAAAKCALGTIGLLSGGVSELVLRDAGAVAVFSSVKQLYEEFESSPLAL